MTEFLFGAYIALIVIYGFQCHKIYELDSRIKELEEKK